MARPTKKGLDYFPFDVGFFEDIKIKRLKSRYGTDGICLYLYLLTQIYAEGYYMEIENEEDFYDDITDTLAIDEGKARQIINYCSDRSMIVEIIPGGIGSHNAQNVPVQGVKVLTAAGIQMRYAQAMKKRKKSLANVKGEYWILSDKEDAELDAFYKSQSETDIAEINEGFSANNPDNSPINSTNKNKLNKTKSDEISDEVSKEEKKNAHRRESYEDIFDECHVRGDYREAFFKFIQHCILNKRTPTNDKIYDIITKLDLAYQKDDDLKAQALLKAVSGGYYDVK